MPSLPYLVLRYTAWLIGLRVLYGLLVNFTGLPNAAGTGVILAAAPMVDIGMQAARRATGPLGLREWAVIWGVCVSVFAAIQIILPAILFAQMRAAMATPVVLQSMILVLASTALMMALFLWIGSRIRR